jgi:hypothetical protein
MHARPSIFFDFLNDYGYIDPRLPLTRASAGTYCDRNGIMRTRSAGNPRFNFDPVSGNPLGLRLEYQETNLFTWSEDLTNAIWVKSNSSITANVASVTAPDGTTNADLLSISAANGYVVQGTGPFTAGFGVTVSVFAKAAASNFLRLNLNDGTSAGQAWFNLATGQVGSHPNVGVGIAYSSAQIEPWPNGWYRCSLTVSTTSSPSCVVYHTACPSDNSLPVGGESIYLWGAQAIVRGPATIFSRPSNYIPTTAAQATRSNDVCQTGQLDAALFDPNQGTLFTDASFPTGGSSWTIATYNGNEALGMIFQVRNDGTNCSYYGQAISTVGGTQGLALDTIPGAYVLGTPMRMAYAYKSGDFSVFCINGRTPIQSAAIITPANFPVNASAHMLIGGAAGNPVGAGIDVRRAAYFPRKLTNAQLQKLTA